MQENHQMQTCKNGIGRWTKENINLVCILHPTNPQDFVQLDYSYETKDKNEKLTCQCWKIRSEKKLKKCATVEETEVNGKKKVSYSTIFCCIKNDP